VPGVFRIRIYPEKEDTLRPELISSHREFHEERSGVPTQLRGLTPAGRTPVCRSGGRNAAGERSRHSGTMKYPSDG
jgi:hypothetical protein